MKERMKAFLRRAAPLAAVVAAFAPFAASAQTASDIIPAASSTEIITGVVTNGWTTFASIVAIIAGVVIIIGLIWMGIRKVYGALTGNARM